MLKRAFFLTVGLGAGVALGVYAVRRVEEARRRMSPEALAAGAGARAGALGERVREALAVGRATAAAREAELRARFAERGGRSPEAAAGGPADRLQDAQWVGAPPPRSPAPTSRP